MGILSLGISFRRAPIELLERLAFTDDDFTKAYRFARDAEGLDEIVILSTCNRVELYGSVPSYHAGLRALKELMATARGVHTEELHEPLYAHWEQDAADHLFSVAAGLDSMVLGETQIHAQVREAIRRAEHEEAAGPALTGIFHAAVHTGRRVRQETALGAAPDAFVTLGADLAEEALGVLGGRSVTVVGAGQMAALAVKHLRGRGVGPVRVLNRSLERARSLAERTGAEHADLDLLPEALASADLVVSATGAAGFVISHPMVTRAVDHRDGRQLVFLDLAVPRDVDPEVAYVPDVRVIDVVALRERIEEQDAETAHDLELAREVVNEEVHRWVVRRRSDGLSPVIRAIRARGEDVVQAELGRWSARLRDLTPDEHEAVEALARGIAAKLLHEPIVELKERSDGATERTYARVLCELLGIDPGTDA